MKDFNTYKLEKIKELEIQIEELKQNIEFYKTINSTLTDNDAHALLENIKDNSFAQSLAKLPLKSLSNKQLLWVHILANRVKNSFSVKTSRANLRLKAKYTFSEISSICKELGYFVKKKLTENRTTVYLLYTMETLPYEYINSFDTTSKLAEYLVKYNPTNPVISRLLIKDK